MNKVIQSSDKSKQWNYKLIQRHAAKCSRAAGLYSTSPKKIYDSLIFSKVSLQKVIDCPVHFLLSSPATTLQTSPLMTRFQWKFSKGRLDEIPSSANRYESVAVDGGRVSISSKHLEMAPIVDKKTDEDLNSRR
ncbi:hypothetical protein AVEN_272236-1 [Araneus ventricosus]|uniref:Uncharacterized protein n=1 Tax=Araneus ventricosus TaxID=182803 RepID=A0A4Y2FZH8_ARAVE|nr:hypothetical protein AVEN_272236-1 [Araneus ventricosus]